MQCFNFQSIFNIRGDVVFAEDNVAIENGKILLTIPEELPGGMYLLKVDIGKHTETKKIIKS
ncbi:MAG: T9SS type A sorting domain-containing protein [Chlorobi bacterium]|nr:T9SS type A sorting domain-containing protein [Chlorobiota bacterium]